METTTITSTAVWYHISSASGDSASRWAKGAARKGLYNGKQTLSMVLFDAGAIREAIGDDQLLGAELVMGRDAAYGIDAVSVSVAPAMVTEIGESYMSRTQCMNMAMRPLHRHNVTEGETATFKVPGATLREIKAGNVNAFLLYQEEDGTDGYCKLEETGTLKLYTGTDWASPVWTRTVSEGGVICSRIYSHIADLRELEYYINLKRRSINLEDMDDIGEDPYDLGSVAGWPDIIEALQDGAEGFVGQGYEWTEPQEGVLPKASIIEELKRAISGENDNRIDSSSVFTGEQSDNARGIDPSQDIEWYVPNAAGSGVIKISAHTPVGSHTEWRSYVSGWIFGGVDSITLQSAQLELNMKSGTNETMHIKLYGVKLSAVPTTERYGTVFHSKVIGEGDCVVGETTKIDINEDGISLFNARTIHGIGFMVSSGYAGFNKEAALIYVE